VYAVVVGRAAGVVHVLGHDGHPVHEALGLAGGGRAAPGAPAPWAPAPTAPGPAPRRATLPADARPRLPLLRSVALLRVPAGGRPNKRLLETNTNGCLRLFNRCFLKDDQQITN